MYCHKCGKEIDGLSRSCNYCGSKLNKPGTINRGKKAKKILLRVIVPVLLCLIIAGFLFNNKKVPVNQFNEQLQTETGFIIPSVNPSNTTILSTGHEVSSEIVSVSFKKDTSKELIREIVADANGVITGEIPGIGYYIKFQSTKTGEEIEKFVEKLRQIPQVETASPEYYCEITRKLAPETDIDTMKKNKWGFEKIRMSEAWDEIRKEDINLKPVTIAVIDTGIDLKHPDLKDNIVLKSNGYSAWDFGDSDTNVSFNWRNLSSGGHGTEVSGIIASVINGRGINGVAPYAHIFPIKFWSERFEWEILSPQKAKEKTAEKVPGYNVAFSIELAVLAEVDVINLSLGREINPNEYRQTLEYKAIQHALRENIIIVAAVGNESSDCTNYFPAAVPGVISVAAIDKAGNRADFSNYSDNVTVAAPGDSIYTLTAPLMPSFERYTTTKGTSIAAPFVSGLAALLKQINPKLGPGEITSVLEDTAEKIPVNFEDNSNHEWKMINAQAAVKSVIKSISDTTDIEQEETGDNMRAHNSSGWSEYSQELKFKVKAPIKATVTPIPTPAVPKPEPTASLTPRPSPGQTAKQTTVSSPAPAKNRYGNTIGNIANDGIAAMEGDWIYYYEYIGKSRGLHKVKTDGTNETVIMNNCRAYYINVINDWLYYQASEKLYKMRTDGSNVTKICDDRARYIRVIGEWIYYTKSETYVGTEIYKIRTDGSGKTRICDDKYVGEMFATDDWIYYVNGNDLCKIKTDGSDKTLLMDFRNMHICGIEDDWIYLTDTDLADNGIYKVKTNGSSKTQLLKGGNQNIVYHMNVYDGWIYYYKDGVYKIKTDGSLNTKISDDKAGNLNVIGDWIYYQIFTGSYARRNLCRIKTDGSNREILTE